MISLEEFRSPLLIVTVVSPILGFAVIALAMLARGRCGEGFVRGVAKTSYRTSLCALLLLLLSLVTRGDENYVAHYIPWFSFMGNHFEIGFIVDALSLGFLALTLILTNLVGDFSETYIHQEPGFERFYLLFLLASFGMILVVTADHLGMTLMGWEFLGISSALLIAFFHARVAPVTNGLTVFVVYRVADLGLILALFFAHHHFEHVSFSRLFEVPIVSGVAVTTLGLLLLFSALGKSSLLPFFPWLPRAMEGPTPSSALFYGAFAVHAGPYLLLRCSPIVSASTTLSVVLVVVGLLSAFFSSLVERIRPDVKTSLAYACMTQIALIYVEIGLHFYTLAAIHAGSHMCLRTYQFLRAPSALHDIHVREKLGVGLSERHQFFDRFLSLSTQQWLYRFAFEEGGIAAIYERFLIGPFILLGNRLALFEQKAERKLEDLFLTEEG